MTAKQVQEVHASTKKQVLAIIGSPKGKGNGYKAVKAVEEQIAKLGEVEFNYLFLRDVDLKPCIGCFACISRGEEYCPLKDDRQKIEEMISRCDGLILSSPGYVQNVSGLMKNFMDRFAYTNHRLRFFEKKVLLVANGGAGLEKTIEALSLAIGGPQVVAKLAYNSPPWPITDNAEAKNRDSIRRVAGEFNNALLDVSPPSPSMGDLMRFRFLKEVSQSCREWLPADYEFYRGKSRYHYEVQINPVKEAAVGVLVPLLMRLMKDMGPKTPNVS